MLNWIRRRLFERDRAIFAYWDGSRVRRIDPLVAFRAMKAHDKFDPDTHLAAADIGDEQAIDIVLLAVREIFGVEPFGEGGGLTIRETLDLAGTFVGYLHTLKKNTSPPPISPASTGQESLEERSVDTSASVAFG